MKEIVDQVLSEARSALRFRWYGLLAAWLICLGGWAWVATQADVFEARARVFVDTSSILEPVLGNQIIASNVAGQLAYIREAILGREQLERIARDVGIGVGILSQQQREQVLNGLRSSIQINSSGLARNSADAIYTLSYRSSDRARAVSVVSAILDNFVEDMIGANRLEGDTAERFLDQQVAEYDLRLVQAEEALATFRKENADRLPGAQGTYFQRIRAEQDALESAYQQLRIMESRRGQLEEQLSGERAVVPGVTDTEFEPPPNSIDARIRDYEIQLDTLLLEYTERHPDVIALRERLSILLEQRAEQLAELGVEDTDQELTSLAENPVYRTLQLAIADTDVEIATLKANIQEGEATIAELRALADEVPEVEAQLARLNRDYEVIYEQYRALVRSRETQDLTRKASDTDQIDFRVIDPPTAPLTPVAPNRPILLAGVLIAGFGVAGGLCVLLAQLWPVFSNTTALRRQTGLPVLGTVAHAWQDKRRAARRRAIFSYGVATASLVLVFIALLGIEIVGPGLSQLLS